MGFIHCETYGTNLSYQWTMRVARDGSLLLFATLPHEYWPTLNLRHYADVVVRRRYDGSEIAGRIGGLYGALAEVVGRGNQRQRRPLWRRMIGGAG
ncbi:MAG: hypothetical protein ABL866_03855 [Devosia sp.]